MSGGLEQETGFREFAHGAEIHDPDPVGHLGDDTQVAPLAVFRRALSMAQSETASLPSFIASVS